MDWDHLKFFHYIAKSGSLSRAAKALNVNHSTVSRRLHSLEKKLQVRLFDKGIEGVKLTPAGESLFTETLAMEQHVHNAHRHLNDHDDGLCGTITVTTEDTIGYLFLPSIIKQFQQEYPNVIINLNISSQFANLTHREADIAITVRKNPPEHLVGRNLTTVRMCFAASKNYLKKNKPPQSLKEMSLHSFISPNEKLGHLKISRWIHKNIPAEKVMFMADKMLTLQKLVGNGLGVSILPHYLVEADEELINLFEMPDQYHSELWILTHPNLRDDLTIKTFMRFVAEKLSF